MVSRHVYNRWIRRYRIFFVIGIVILSFQVYLALRFFTINSEKNATSNAWIPYNLKSDDLENSVNSAKKVRESLVIDDEDIQQISKRTPSIPKQTKLNLEELDFIPACDIVTKEAISAIHRAKTQKCKQDISNITCLIQKGLLYPTELPNYCMNDGFEMGKSLGCFKDEKNFRILNGYYGNSKDNSPKYCMRLCLQSGYPFAGVQYSTECFCGNDEPPVTAKLPDSSCNMKCPSDPHLICGGYFTTNIYQTGIKKFYPQVAATSGTSTKPVKIVFLLTLNGRALRQVKRLIKILYNRDHYFYIHVDVRQDYLFRELLSLEKQFPNIRLTRRRFSTIWGGASLLSMLLSCMKELLSIDWKWDFVLNLSESDYPVKTTNRLVEFLSINREKNFVKSHGREVQRFIQKQGLDKTFIECDTHMWRTGDRKLPWGVQIDGGSDWVALSHKFVQYVATDYPDQLIEGLLLIFKYTLLPAESFFHTVLRNSKFCNTYVDNNLHVTNWKRKLGCKCQYKHVVDWCGCSPNDFKPEDWLRIQNTETRQLYFARKFEPVINQAVILQLEQWLFGIDFGKNITNINSYWQSIYNHLDLGTTYDDSLITVSHSLVRHKLKNLKNCPIAHKSNILEISSYHLNDINEEILVLFQITQNNTKITLETSFKPKNTFLLKKSSQFSKRFKSLTVSSDYDQKEQVSRNFPRTLGPFSEPVLIYTVTNSDVVKSTNVSFLWIDPTGRLVELSEASIDENFNTGHIKPNLRQPLLPGEWTVKLVYKNEVHAETSLLITPLTYLSGNNIAQSQVNFFHGGTDILKEFDQSWDKFLVTNDKRDILESLSKSNSKRFGHDLEEWVDNLFSKFYKIGSLCIVNNFNLCNANIPRCKSTSWSSLSPDPKSFIGKINETTGGFNLW